MQNFIELRLYADQKEKICYEFQPVRRNSAPDWNPQWEEWHSYTGPLRIYQTDFERLLKKYISALFPTADACDGTELTEFDFCFDNWLSETDYQKLIKLIQEDQILPEQKEFYDLFLHWLKHALEQRNIIVIESNL
ncbi:MAG: BdrN protein [Oscillospiraceae bacterium]|nr:BdrN protein [Oscillospiraceae bacterium]